MPWNLELLVHKYLHRPFEWNLKSSQLSWIHSVNSPDKPVEHSRLWNLQMVFGCHRKEFGIWAPLLPCSNRFHRDSTVRWKVEQDVSVLDFSTESRTCWKCRRQELHCLEVLVGDVHESNSQYHLMKRVPVWMRHVVDQDWMKSRQDYGREVLQDEIRISLYGDYILNHLERVK